MGSGRLPASFVSRILLPPSLRPKVASFLGLVMVAVISVIAGPLLNGGHSTLAVLLLVLPIILVAVLGGPLPALGIALAAAVAADVFFFKPLGSVRVEGDEDLVVLVMFVLVGLTTGLAVALATEAFRSRAATLEHLAEQRRSLLRAVSHDLRSPLTAIKAVATDLRHNDTYEQAARNELLEVLSDEADRLDRFVANLLSMSRIESGSLHLDLVPIDVGHLVASTLVRLQRLTRSVHLRCAIDDDLPLVPGDAVAVQQVIVNLVDNAVKHSPPGGEVTVRVACGVRSVMVSVTDGGPGLGERNPDELFEPFAGHSGTGSTGVGLAICRGIVEEHGGRISASGAVGGGACFTFEIPTNGVGDR